MVITHNKQTMGIADSLFGVTMEEPGISKLVSVRLGDLAARLRTHRSGKNPHSSEDFRVRLLDFGQSVCYIPSNERPEVGGSHVLLCRGARGDHLRSRVLATAVRDPSKTHESDSNYPRPPVR